MKPLTAKMILALSNRIAAEVTREVWTEGETYKMFQRKLAQKIARDLGILLEAEDE